jgi:penicillin amidase
MNSLSRRLLEGLGRGDSIAAVCKLHGVRRSELNEWWRDECARRVPKSSGRFGARVSAAVEIQRDRFGIPHIFAANDRDLFFGFGVAMAQDRLWQLDWLRRRAHGTLAEVLGRRALDSDVLARTVGFTRIARANLRAMPASTRRLVDGFVGGINSVIESTARAARPPIEFDILDYRPAPWRAIDVMATWVEFQWYLTGRFPVIVLPELARRVLGDGPLYEAFLTAEADDESIVPAGSYPKARRRVENIGTTVGDPDDGRGSNNWAVSGARSATGKPLVASDPHIGFGALSCWYEAHLSGKTINVAGTAYVGVPAIIIGRTEGVAWGVTNNICSQRDLYLEQGDQRRPGYFRSGRRWERARQVVETVRVKGESPVRKVVRFSRNGPIVNELLPSPARGIGPVSLRWMGATRCDELTVFVELNRARSCAELRKAVRGWRVPTWSLVFGDTRGHIGYQCVGRIPVRKVAERGLRPGWDPTHRWQGVIPFDRMPALSDPDSGWVRSANNRTAPPDFPYPLAGTWGSGHRARRIRQILEATPKSSLDGFRAMHLDSMNLRAVDRLNDLVAALRRSRDPKVKQATTMLAGWDCRMEPESGAAVIFEAFFRHWSSAVAGERFGDDAAVAGLIGGGQSGGARMTELAAGAVGGLALELLGEDRAGWFASGRRQAAIDVAMKSAIADLERRQGQDMSKWSWGKLHRVALRHPLSGIGDLGRLLDRGGQPVGGNSFTVGNTGAGADYEAPFGANYRFAADLREPVAWAVDHAGQSGHPGSAHYCDQTADWAAARYHAIPLDRNAVVAEATLRLMPKPAPKRAD